ncbi:hypothetical protein [Polymorphobacter fuscus]|uniref:Uncharacterized protein n=1 Tax=Sandarakinorhabdus fusca TaxID=1439888 RepID=A0A7C9KM32_9SPHN|nr:hypothetical protein [Polymorphobacter fuscus]KAB7647450.1 hypothetical protein F9290_05455 [Polymorphobacter fuscus]MQT16704.1 hypothetical protein [Polymorphobacter fuscus]NJC09309.1 hypothetical protein [Polymorphobacter fuscus]
MNNHNRFLALTLIGWCAVLLPPERASWAAAMKAEVAAIEDGKAALSFAVGCIWGSLKERTLTMTFAARSMRFATICGMLALSILSAAIAGRLVDAHASSALVFGLTSALFAAAAVWSYLRGALALVQTASSMIPLYIVAYAFVSPDAGTAGAWINARLYHALAIEGIVIWAALLTCGIFMLRAETLHHQAHVS